ncbi:glycosyltransferase [Candidatus Pseudomonas adelgestsugas]|uniref:UDP-Glc:alpha-D-GlcNAc-diphosphoundecaprenol beta-1,3-glucosyltransferase WfgD n=1 Tax=Candidatus Pseudomonas adelgestsugas TaxID=1302376 RepID=A0ABX5R9S4_9PSED|nr:glycosyltransferase [Candidatus Pseudomonas adelgestsugas]QAX82162.1 UDP-Glc:alpha-D-GlcNAc-diphosphoundecaprenol beta-1,3-glucosyltransferase WfgD [Candidatus Pseudomonas adelgestsugas]
MSNTLISVIMATFNHASYVKEAITSVLNQHGELEFLIADDGSTDGTREIIESMIDPRIRFFPHYKNRGACTVTNELIALSKGQFIALINSDDFWCDNNKLAYQLQILLKNPQLGATFSQAYFIDKHGNHISKNRLTFGSVFEQQNRSRGKWLRLFFDQGNCICHPTILIRRACYNNIGVYNNNLRQLPDFDMWVRLVKKYQIYISEQQLISFRVLPRHSASSQTVANSIRSMNEHYLIATSFFQNVRAQELKDGFCDLLKYPNIPSDIHLNIEKTLLFFMPNKAFSKVYEIVGILKLNRLLSSDRHREVLEKDYKINASWYHRKMQEVAVLRPKFSAVVSNNIANLKSVYLRLFRS